MLSSELSELELLPDDVLGYQITYLPFTDVKQLCETSKRLNNFCLGTSTKQSNIWRNVIHSTFSNVVNYNDILLKLSKQYNCDGPCYNYYVYVNFINYLDQITQLMIYYKQKDLNSFKSDNYTNEERFVALFMLGNKEGMKKYEQDMPDRGRYFFYTLLEGKKPSQTDLDDSLGWGSRNRYLGVVKYLVEQGADIRSDDDDALRSASFDGHLEVVKYLVRLGADVRANDDYALKWSSTYGHLEVVKYLVEQGANVRAEDDYALKWSSANGHLEVVKYLVGHGADIHADDEYALTNASIEGYLEVVKYLVEQGADVHANNDEALRNAKEFEHIEVVRYLESLP